jgi:hypothetical protein
MRSHWQLDEMDASASRDHCQQKKGPVIEGIPEDGQKSQNVLALTTTKIPLKYR